MTNLIKSLLILFVFGMAFSFTSCKKCTTCEIKYNYEGEPEQTIDLGETCGKKADVEKFEDDCAAGVKTWEDLGVESANCTCN